MRASPLYSKSFTSRSCKRSYYALQIRNARLATRRSSRCSARFRCCPHGPSRCPRFTGLLWSQPAVPPRKATRRDAVPRSSSLPLRSVLLMCLLHTQTGHSARGGERPLSRRYISAKAQLSVPPCGVGVGQYRLPSAWLQGADSVTRRQGRGARRLTRGCACAGRGRRETAEVKNARLAWFTFAAGARCVRIA